MAKLIPNEVDWSDPRRNGERIVFECLSDANIPGTAFYSLLQKNHKHKLIGEVDFLYVSERGLLCLEVKGGQEISREDHRWYSKNKKGILNSISNPFVQAKDCSYALKRYFEETYGFRSPQARYLIGYGVIFPECKFTGDGNDLVTEVMFDSRFSIDDFGTYLKNTFDYWENLEIERHGYQPEKLTPQQLRQVLDLLRGDFAVVPSMSLELQQVERKMLLLTEEQFDVLDITENNPRVIVQGCAGTGKSILALEKVRECAAREKKVLYLCYNKNMSVYARNSLHDSSNKYTTVSTFHALLLDLIGDPSLFRLSVSELCNIFLSSATDFRTYDYVVIDEGQDLLLPEVVDVVNKILVNGVSNGNWVVFLDPNQNIFHCSEEYSFAMEYLKDSGHPVIYTLNYNCRNTEQIALRTAALSLVPPAKKLKIAGPNVVAKPYTDENDFVEKFRKEIHSVIAGGLAAKDIVVLSKKKLSNSCLNKLHSVCNLNIVEGDSIADFQPHSLNYFTVQSYKGLESNIVFFIDIDGFGEDKHRLLNYVGMSRAKLLLYIFYNANAQDDYSDTLDQGREMLGNR